MSLCSMTGYGRCQREEKNFVQQWEIRSVNGRFLDLKWKLPASTRAFEARFEKAVRSVAQRGRVDISLLIQPKAGVASGARFDAATAASMLEDMKTFAEARGDVFRPDYAALFAVPQLWQSAADEEDEDSGKLLEAGLQAALEDWTQARRNEAEALRRDIAARVSQMKEWLGQIEERAPAIKTERFEQVRDRLTETLAALGSELEESRFLQEMVIMADKLDVSEEITRMHAHLDRMEALLASGNDAGRKLDFTLQECFREINTCGNKIQDVSVSRLVVDFKNELEKCREQVQNLE